MRKSLGGPFVILLISRVFGLLREILISVAFGFSKITDAFYQSTFSVVALQTVANGPFTTAFSARFAHASDADRGAHLRYYMRLAVQIGAALAIALAAAAIVCATLWPAGAFLALPLAILTPAVLGTAVTGYVYAVATAFGRIATAALVLFVANAVFVLGVVVLWLAGQSLTSWTLPALYSFAALVGTAFALQVYRRLLGETARGSDASVRPKPIQGFGLAFLFAGVETAFFLLTQSIILILAGLAGAGWASAISVVQRIVFSINGLVISPAATLLMLRVAKDQRNGLAPFLRALISVAFGLAAFGALLSFVAPLLLHAFLPATSPRHATASQIITLLPAFAAWLVPLGVNVVICRVMFGLKLDRLYTSATVVGYALANVARLAVFSVLGLASAIVAGAAVELLCVVYLAIRTRGHLLAQVKTDGEASPDLVLFTMAYHSGMGRFACELTNGAGRVGGDAVVFIAPKMDHEPLVGRRVLFRRPIASGARWRKIASLVAMNLEAWRAVWRESRPGATFIMIDLYSTVPLSIVPVWIARLRGAATVLNLHDFYPHALRFPRRLAGLERWLYRMAYRQFSLIAAMKEEQVGRLVDEAGVARSRIVVIEHGAFPIEGLQYPALDDDVFRVLILGSLRANKMILESITAVHALQAEHRRLALRVAGAPRREERAYWRQCQEALRDIENLELTDRFIADEEMAGVLSGVDALLCPYGGFDSQSGVSIVGVSNGVPLVATRSAFVAGAEALAEVQRPVTSESIAAALDSAMRQPRAERLRHAEAQREAFLAQSHWTRAIERILAALGATSNA